VRYLTRKGPGQAVYSLLWSLLANSAFHPPGSVNKTSFGREGKGRYGSLRSCINTWIACKTVRSQILRQRVSYRSAPGVRFSLTDAISSVAVSTPLPLPRQQVCVSADCCCCSFTPSDRLRFWADHENINDKLSLVAEDVISAPASQAYVQSLFGLWHAHH